MWWGRAYLTCPPYASPPTNIRRKTHHPRIRTHLHITFLVDRHFPEICRIRKTASIPPDGSVLPPQLLVRPYPSLRGRGKVLRPIMRKWPIKNTMIYFWIRGECVSDGARRETNGIFFYETSHAHSAPVGWKITQIIETPNADGFRY